MLDWDDLRFFLEVARAGTLTAAARALRVAQPTVGRRVAQLEAKLGARLFAATPRGQLLTSTGRQIVELAARMQADAVTVERLAAGRDSGVRGPLRITASEWLIERVLAPAAASLIAQHPDLEIDLVGDPRPLNLVQRDADLAVRPARFTHQDVVEVPAGWLAFGLYASAAYLARWGPPDFRRQCEGHRLVAMSESMTTIADVDWLPRFASRARIVARANGRLPLASLAAAGTGLAILPRHLGDELPALRLLHPPGPAPRRKLWLAFHRDARTVPRIRVAVAYLKAVLNRELR